VIKFIDKYISCTQSNSDYFYQFHKHKKCCKIFQHDNNIIKEFDIEKFIDSRTQDNGKESYIETAYRNETFLYKMTKTILDYIEKLNIISYIKEIGLKYLHKIYYYAKDKSIYILSGVLIYFFLKMIWKSCFRNRFLLLDDDEI
jgi:hypothetical protein